MSPLLRAPILALGLLTLIHPARADELIAEYEGQGMQTMRPFTTDTPWEVQWQAKGSLFQIYAYAHQGPREGWPDVLANQMGSGKGSAYRAGPGTFHLTINAIGSWTVRVVTVE